jgi:hypothetical protein
MKKEYLLKSSRNQKINKNRIEIFDARDNVYLHTKPWKCQNVIYGGAEKESEGKRERRGKNLSLLYLTHPRPSDVHVTFESTFYNAKNTWCK